MLTPELVTLMNPLSLRTLTKLMKRHFQTCSALNSSKPSYSGNCSILKANRVKERQENGVLAATAKSLFHAQSAEVKGQLVLNGQALTRQTCTHMYSRHVPPVEPLPSVIRSDQQLKRENLRQKTDDSPHRLRLGIQNLLNFPHVVLTAI